MTYIKKQSRRKRHKRIRAKIEGTAQQPRLCVFCSNQYTYGQLIDDTSGKTLFSFSDLNLKTESKGKQKKSNKVDLAKAVGMMIAKQALKSKIDKIVFDRGGYKYHGRVKALAEGAREGGLKF